MSARATPRFALTTPPLTQEQLDAISHIAVAGSDTESSDSEIELEDPVVTADQRARRLNAFVNSNGPWTPYSQRRHSVATAITDIDRLFPSRDQSPPRRDTR